MRINFIYVIISIIIGFPMYGMATTSTQSNYNVKIIRTYYPADGGERYSIITANGKKLATDIDPRQVSRVLAKRYKANDWLIVNNGQPYTYLIQNGREKVVVPLKILNGCRACAPVAQAQLVWYFHDGALTTVNVASFKPY